MRLWCIFRKKVGAGRGTNPVPRSAIAEASHLYQQFTGHEATHYQKIPLNTPKAALQVGSCDGILYTTVRDGVTEHYIHKFKKSAQPVLAASSDGKQLFLLGGNFNFTERGIVDN